MRKCFPNGEKVLREGRELKPVLGVIGPASAGEGGLTTWAAPCASGARVRPGVFGARARANSDDGGS